MSKINLTKTQKEEIGLQCCNCGSKIDLQYHHIVPLSLGGNNILSNLCCLCYKCHSLLHFGNKKNINHSEATKAGIQKAKAQGKQIGMKKGTKLITKKSITSKEKIRELNIDFNGNLSNEETYKFIGISRKTFYKYKAEMRQEDFLKEQSKKSNK